MKKRLALLLAALLLCSAGIGVAIGRLQDTRAAVYFTERVLYGNAAEAAGITVGVRTQLGGHLFWDTDYEVGGKTRTDFRFFADEQREVPVVTREGVGIWSNFNQGVNLGVPADEQSGFAKIFREMYDSAEEDVKYEREVRLGDVYPYYPIRFHFDVFGVFWTGNDADALMEENPKSEKYVNNYLQNYFKIPVLQEESYTLSLRRSRDGLSTSIKRSSADGFELSSVSAHTAHGEGAAVTGAIYFAISDRTDLGARVDTSLIPGGRAVYRIPYAYGLGYADTGLDVDALSPIYSLAPDEDVREMMTTSDGAYLILLTEQAGQTVVTVLSTETHTVKDRYTCEEGLYRTAFVTDTLLILRFESGFSLFERTETGYTHRFFCAEADEDGMTVFSKGTYAFGYDGARLAVVGRLYTEDFHDATCGFSLAVYGEEGIRYYGIYENSQDASSGGDGPTLAGQDPFTVILRQAAE